MLIKLIIFTNKFFITSASTRLAANSDNVAKVKTIIMHEEYSPANTYANDIALLELSGTMAFNYKTIAPINLPEEFFETAQTPEGEPGVLAGWGLNAVSC